MYLHVIITQLLAAVKVVRQTDVMCVRLNPFNLMYMNINSLLKLQFASSGKQASTGMRHENKGLSCSVTLPAPHLHPCLQSQWMQESAVVSSHPFGLLWLVRRMRLAQNRIFRQKKFGQKLHTVALNQHHHKRSIQEEVGRWRSSAAAISRVTVRGFWL